MTFNFSPVDYSVPFDNAGTDFIADNVHDAIIEAKLTASAARYITICSYKGNAGPGRWYEFAPALSSDTNPLIMNTDGYLRGVSVSVSALSTGIVGIYFNNIKVAELTITNALFANISGLDIAYSETAALSVKTESGSLSKPLLAVFGQSI